MLLSDVPRSIAARTLSSFPIHRWFSVTPVRIVPHRDLLEMSISLLALMSWPRQESVSLLRVACPVMRCWPATKAEPSAAPLHRSQNAAQDFQWRRRATGDHKINRDHIGDATGTGVALAKQAAVASAVAQRHHQFG